MWKQGLIIDVLGGHLHTREGSTQTDLWHVGAQQELVEHWLPVRDRRERPQGLQITRARTAHAQKIRHTHTHTHATPEALWSDQAAGARESPRAHTHAAVRVQHTCHIEHHVHEAHGTNDATTFEGVWQ